MVARWRRHGMLDLFGYGICGAHDVCAGDSRERW